jgi:CRP/FNR family transcriptional regulator
MPEILNTAVCNTCAFRSLLFENLTDDELIDLNTNKIEKKYYKKEIVVEQGQNIREFLYLKEGLIKLVKKDGMQKEHIINIARPLNFIGFLSVFSNDKYQYSITAIEDSVMCFIELDVLKETIRNNGVFAMEVLEKISKISDDIIQFRMMIDRRQLRGRIAYILVMFAKQVYFKSKFYLPLSRKEIAELIDMSTENVIRILSEFRKDNIIRIDGSLIEILNIGQLERICRFG